MKKRDMNDPTGRRSTCLDRIFQHLLCRTWFSSQKFRI